MTYLEDHKAGAWIGEKANRVKLRAVRQTGVSVKADDQGSASNCHALTQVGSRSRVVTVLRQYVHLRARVAHCKDAHDEEKRRHSLHLAPADHSTPSIPAQRV
jgi:hypothetical protein